VSSVELIGDEIRVWIIMLDPRLFAVFLAAAFLLAITPGPGIFYVLTRALTGGTRESFNLQHSSNREAIAAAGIAD